MSAFTQTFQKYSPLSHLKVYTFVNQVYAFINLSLGKYLVSAFTENAGQLLSD